MPPLKRIRPASGGLPPVRPGRCFRPASGGLPPTQRRPARPDRVAGPHAKAPGRSSPGRTPGAPLTDAEHDREVLAAIAAGDPAGIATAYDRYAAGLYGYCHWMLHDAAGAAESVQDTFVLAAATLGELPEPAKLRPWLFALARNECRRRIRPRPAARDEGDAANQQAGRDQRADEGQSAAEVGQAADAIGGLADATVQFSVLSEPADAIGGLADATVQFSVVSEPADALRDLGDPTVQFSVVSEPADALRDLGDPTMQFSVVGQLADATMQFRVLREPADTTDGIADFNGYLGQAELRELIRSILADMKPREREVVELSFRHDLFDDDLAIALGLSVEPGARPGLTHPRPAGKIARCAAHRAGRSAGLPGDGGTAGRLGWATDRANTRPGRLARRAVPDLRQSRAGRAAPDGSFRPAAAVPAPSGTAGAGPEPLLLHCCGRGGLPPTGGPARGIDLGGTILAGDQADELGQHPSPSRSGDRYYSCRGMARGGRECHAAHLHWLPSRACPDGPAN